MCVQPFNLMKEINGTIKLQNSINDTNPFNLVIKHGKVQGSTMKVYQSLDHVQINLEHTFEYGRWQSLSIFPTYQIQQKKKL